MFSGLRGEGLFLISELTLYHLVDNAQNFVDNA